MDKHGRTVEPIPVILSESYESKNPLKRESDWFSEALSGEVGGSFDSSASKALSLRMTDCSGR